MLTVLANPPRPRRRIFSPAGLGRPLAVIVGPPMVVCLVGALVMLATPPASSRGEAAPLPPERPACERELGPGIDLQASVDAAAPGTILCLLPGRFSGPLRLAQPLTLWGPREAVIFSAGAGDTLTIPGDDVSLLGFTVDGSGHRMDTSDAAVRITGRGARVEGLTIDHALFGILAEETEAATIVNNTVRGDALQRLGLRGDPIRLFGTTDSLVQGNVVENGRDVVLWYSSNNRIEDNLVRGNRYGTHFMYSHNCQVLGNRFESNAVGVFIMYSHDITVADNLFADAGGSALGLGLKDAGNITVNDNHFFHLATALHVESSPQQLDHSNHYENNRFELSNVAIVFHATPHASTFHGNRFRGNQSPVQVMGGGDARQVDWLENDFDDYVGYDLDGDGFGDLPYELVSFANEMTGRRPELAFFRGTATLWLVDAAGRLSPSLRPRTLLVDTRPRVGALTEEDDGAH